MVATRKNRSSRPSSASDWAQSLVGFSLVALVVVLPLLMPQRTPELMTISGLLMLCLALMAATSAAAASARSPGSFSLPGSYWWLVFIIVSVAVLLQVLPLAILARLFGPYPEIFWHFEYFEPGSWSPNPAATLRGWGIFVALFTVAWLSGQLEARQRNWLWLAIAISVIAQASYGLFSHTTGIDVMQSMEGHGRQSAMQGSFSNRNLFAAYLALGWPLVISVWWLRDVPILSRLPTELRVTGTLLAGSVVGAAIFASASRLGAMAGIVGAVSGFLLLIRHRGRLSGFAILPAWLAVIGTFLVAAWIGLEPLADRIAVSEAEEYRLVAFALMFREFPWQWWVHGVGLGGFEAVFKTIQTDQISGWWDYAHSDLIQWLLEMGLPGLLILILVVTGLFIRFELTMERIPLYAGLLALALVGLGDFSWHIPATQVVLAIYIGTLLQSPSGRSRRRRSRSVANRDQNERKRKRKRRRGGSLHGDLLD